MLVECPTDGQQHQRTQKKKNNDTARHGNSNMNDREWNLYQSPRLCVDVPHTRCALGSAQHAALAPPTRKRNCCVKPIVRCPTKSLSSCPLLSQPFRRGLLALAIVYGTVGRSGKRGVWRCMGSRWTSRQRRAARPCSIRCDRLAHVETRTGYCNLGLAMLG